MLRKPPLIAFAVALCVAAIGCEQDVVDVTTPSVPKAIITQTPNGPVTVVSPGTAATLGTTSQSQTQQSSSSDYVGVTTIVGGDLGGADLTPVNGDVLSGIFTNVGTFSIALGATVFVAGGTALSVAANAVSIDGTLDATGAGFAGGPSPPSRTDDIATAGIAGSGPGGGAAGGAGFCVHSQSGGGAGYGGTGGDGGTTFIPTTFGPPVAPGGIAYGTSDPPGIQKGSGGGSGGAHCGVDFGGSGGVGGPGGAGGGAVEISAGQISVSGSILASGANAGPGVAPFISVSGGGGGSGGGILLDGALSLTGALSAPGGNGSAVVGISGFATGGGGGAGGRVKLSGCTNENTAVVSVAGGSPGGGSIVKDDSDPLFGPGVFPTAGGAGTFVDATTGTCNVAPEFVSPPTPPDGALLPPVLANHLITFDVEASDPDAGQTVTLTATLSPGSGFTFTTTAGNPATGTFSWIPTVVDVSPPNHTAVVTATDDFGATATTSVDIEVLPDPCQGLVDCQAEILETGVPGKVEVKGVADNKIAAFDTPADKYDEPVIVKTKVLTGPPAAAPSSGPFGAAFVDETCHHEFLLRQDGDCLQIDVENVDGTEPASDNQPATVAHCRAIEAFPGADNEKLLFLFTEKDGDVEALENISVPGDPLDCDPANGALPSSNRFIRFASGLLNRARQWLAPRPAFAAAMRWEDRGLAGRTRTPNNFFVVWADPSIEVSAAEIVLVQNGRAHGEFIVAGTLLGVDFTGFGATIPARVTFGDPNDGGFVQDVNLELLPRRNLYLFKVKGQTPGIRNMTINVDGGDFVVEITRAEAELAASVDLSDPLHRFVSFTVRVGAGTDLHGTGIPFVEELDEFSVPTGNGVFPDPNG